MLPIQDSLTWHKAARQAEHCAHLCSLCTDYMRGPKSNPNDEWGLDCGERSIDLAKNTYITCLVNFFLFLVPYYVIPTMVPSIIFKSRSMTSHSSVVPPRPQYKYTGTTLVLTSTASAVGNTDTVYLILLRLIATQFPASHQRINKASMHQQRSSQCCQTVDCRFALVTFLLVHGGPQSQDHIPYSWCPTPVCLSFENCTAVDAYCHAAVH